MANVFLDIIALGVVVIAAIVGMCKGFFATLLSLLGFLGTFALAYFFSDDILNFLNGLCNFTEFFQSFAGSTVGNILATIVVFLGTFFLIRLVIFILNHTVGKLFKGKKIGSINTAMGCVLGAVKGCVYVVVILVVVNVASLIPTIRSFTTTAFEQTYVVGQIYDWVGAQLGNYFYIGDGETKNDSSENT